MLHGTATALRTLRGLHSTCARSKPWAQRHVMQATARMDAVEEGRASASKRRGQDERPPLPTAPPTAAYVHLPFCHRKCRYCDFPVIAVGKNAETDEVRHSMERYVELLLKELRATARLNDPNEPLQTVFFGGGTPSLLSLPLLDQLLLELDRTFGIAPAAEISIEADPGTFDAERLRSYRRMGITRVSVGVQAFQDQLLQLCGRAHDVADVYRAVEAVYAADVPSWSLDLMSGLPELTEEMWEHSLAQALDAGPHHISVYDLQVEEHTPFARLYTPGEAPLPNDDAAARMYCTASTSLRSAGFEHYELSNYAKPGHRCWHNMTYWEGGSFYGLGLGSASYLEGRRFSRPKRMAAYSSWVEKLAAEADLKGRLVPGSHLPPEGEEDRILDTIMLRLRLGDGLDLQRHLAEPFPNGKQAAKIVLAAMQPRIEDGLVLHTLPQPSGAGDAGGASSGSIVDRAGKDEAVGVLRLADPEGFVVSNDIISDAFAAFDITQQGGGD